jgi:hypothetical protein
MRLATLAIAVVLLLAAGVSAAVPATSNVATVKDVPPVTPPPVKSPDQGGDTIATATLIATLPYNDTGTTAGYANDYDEACPYTGSLSPDVVYKYTPTTNIIVNIFTCNSGYDTKIYVYDNVYTPGAPLACNDDSDICTGPSWRSYIQQLQLYAGHTYYIVVDGYGGAYGAYEFHVHEYLPPPPCYPEVCPPYALVEGEPVCYTGYTDAYNGGCNSSPNVFQPIAFPQTICGTSGVYMFGTSTHRDTDWYQFTLTATTNVKFCVCAQFTPLLGFIDASLGCGLPQFITYTTGTANTDVCLTYTLPAGTYWAFVAPSSWDPSFTCGVKYRATLWDENYTPVESASWGTLKALYR